METMPPRGGAFSAPYVLEYTYRRSVGPVIGRFLAGLRDLRIEGVRTRSGKVLVPPAEYDPESGETPGEFVEVGSSGIVTTWAWVERPRPTQPLAHPFAWALIRLDGADTALLHAVDAGSQDRMRTGMRVTARWSEERVGGIRDIACFEPEDVKRVSPARASPSAEPPIEGTRMGAPVRRIQSPVRLEYTVTAGQTLSRFLGRLLEARLLGLRCPECHKVYVPPKGACPTCGVPCDEEVEVQSTGTVTTFCIVNVPYEGQTMTLPYVYASILLDGADLPMLHAIQGIAACEVRMGLRVRAEWLPPEERRPTLESIRWFSPTGEPDASYETYKDHL